LRLGRLLKTSPQFWMRLQADWDLQEAIQRAGRKAS
jgi:plasmid maintenance system antidote protein VapI